MGVYYLSSIVTQLVYITLLATIFSLTSYLAISQQSADGGALNPARAGHYLASTWLSLAYLGELGAFFGILVSLNFETALALVIFVANILIALSDFAFQTDQLPHPALVGVSDAVAAKYCLRYFHYAIFGVDRCPPGQESWILKTYSVDSQPIAFYIWRILENILVLRLASLLVLYGRLQSFSFWKAFFNYFDRKTMESELRFIPLEFDNGFTNVAMDSCSGLEPTLEDECLAQSRILVAWRQLTLFESSPAYYRTSGSGLENRKRILSDLNGEVRAGTLTAIMGASGAGKTSLLKTLNGRLRSRIAPDTQFYLSCRDPITTCFITQDVTNHLFPALTVKQNLIYASRFKNQRLVDGFAHEKIAESLLIDFGMRDAENTRVEQCSGGERKRLALALELTAQRMPNLVCFDEPTSGLDSDAAEAMIACFRALVQRHNIALIASIHQPTTRILELLDQLYLLAPGGVCVASGHPVTLLDSIEDLLEQSYAGVDDPQVQNLIKAQKDSLLPEEILLKDTLIVDTGIPANRTRFSLSSVWILSCRYATYFRSYWWIEATILSSIYIAYGLTMILFFDTRTLAQYSGCIDLETVDLNQTCVAAEPAIKSQGYVYFTNNIFLLSVSVAAGVSLLRDLALFYNEHRNGWYSSGAFYLHKSLFDFLPFVPIFAVYVYIIDIYDLNLYWPLLGLYLLQIVTMQSLGYALTLISRQRLILMFINFFGTVLLFGLLSGMLTPVAHMHYAYRLLSELNIFRHSLEAQALLQFGFGRCESGLQFYLIYLGIEDADYGRALLMLTVNLILYRGVAGYLLIVCANPRRRRIQTT